MEPITLATIALTLVATKATEKIGEHIGEGVISSAKQLLTVLRRRSPDTVKQLEAASASGRDADVIDVDIIAEVQRVAAADPEVEAALKATTAAVAAEPATFQNLTKLADKIGVVNLAPVENQTNHISI
ncbi:MAG: hypothetical protein AAFN12_00845 [Cyanobacteria bacterium J06560_2]